MPLSVGDTLPDVSLKSHGADGIAEVTTGELFAGKRVVLFAVPGAFTPSCSETHLPGFVVKADVLLARGVDVLACLSVNDAFVMRAWQQSQNAQSILMLADGNADFTRAIGMENDRHAAGMGMRSLRYALVAEDGVVRFLGVDTERGVVDQSSVDAVLAHL
ncbi:peroxiredoxin [Halomonas campisalis]|uniref:Glutathione-dependent peroxiredoxin n=1 Tax=Billgrantia campisalis TaxID=74661 RepID=A0ABS9PC18_9GAMM|nr:peroxiredoxin [Halomonas campisalis]MCG6659319.1 peroxiredoxin [Halomonas campisalis]MDR5863921.1 peroxiredoxin [Halomonas campisalis]